MPWTALTAPPLISMITYADSCPAVDERLISGHADRRWVALRSRPQGGSVMRPTADQPITVGGGRWWSGVVGGDFSQTVALLHYLPVTVSDTL